MKWKGRWFAISAVAKTGCEELCREAMIWVEEHSRTPEQLERDVAEEMASTKPAA